MAFVSAPVLVRAQRRVGVCGHRRVRMCDETAPDNKPEDAPPPAYVKLAVTNTSRAITNDTPVTDRKLVRNISDLDDTVSDDGAEFATPSAGEVGGPKVGDGLQSKSARKGIAKEDKKVTKSAAAQGSMGFADAWASQNRDRGGSQFDVWFWIGLSFVRILMLLVTLHMYAQRCCSCSDTPIRFMLACILLVGFVPVAVSSFVFWLSRLSLRPPSLDGRSGLALFLVSSSCACVVSSYSVRNNSFSLQCELPHGRHVRQLPRM
jgi:hypothetical protein